MLLPSPEERTRGIELHWTSSKNHLDSGLQWLIWDLGGHEEYHMTHECLMDDMRGSVFCIVLCDQAGVVVSESLHYKKATMTTVAAPSTEPFAPRQATSDAYKAMAAELKYWLQLIVATQSLDVKV